MKTFTIVQGHISKCINFNIVIYLKESENSVLIKFKWVSTNYRHLICQFSEFLGTDTYSITYYDQRSDGDICFDILKASQVTSMKTMFSEASLGGEYVSSFIKFCIGSNIWFYKQSDPAEIRHHLHRNIKQCCIAVPIVNS